MEAERTFEYYGALIKAEKLYTLEEKVMPNTFVLEAPEPFPGFFHYYHEHPGNNMPLYVYLVLDTTYSLEDITRATQNILSYCPKPFDAAKAFVTLHNESFCVIRLRHFELYDILADIQQAYIDEGIKMHKLFRKNINDDAIIRMQKFFSLKQVSDNVMFDIKEPDHAYFFIDKPLKWKNFEHTTMLIKSNWHRTLFDAAMGHFYVDFKIRDMVRIYDTSLKLDDVEGIAKLYRDMVK